MSETKEKQFLVSRRPANKPEDADLPFRPLYWFDSRAEARRYAKEKVARQKKTKFEYAIDPIRRGPRA